MCWCAVKKMLIHWRRIDWVVSKTVYIFIPFYAFFLIFQSANFTVFLSCCTRFREHCLHLMELLLTQSMAEERSIAMSVSVCLLFVRISREPRIMRRWNSVICCNKQAVRCQARYLESTTHYRVTVASPSSDVKMYQNTISGTSSRRSSMYRYK